MKLSRCEDWESASKRLDAFWEHEIIDRPCVQVYAPADPKDWEGLSPDPSTDYEAQWNDPKVVFNNYRFGYMHSHCMGEAFPNYYPNWDGVHEMLGSKLQYDAGTIWVRPTVDTIVDVSMENLRIDNPIAQALIAKLDYLTQHCAGEAFVGLPPMGNCGDHLAMVCGYSNLCIDLIENPDVIMACERVMTDFWKQMYDKLYETMTKWQEGTCGWLPSWYRGRGALLEMDFCAMISPKMFDMYLPFLLERASWCDRSIYHLDGPDALKHLDTLLAQKEIDAIQWEPGIACADICEWIPLMQKIQAAGKGLYVAGVRYSPESVLELYKNLKPEGLIIPVGVSSVDEGHRFIEKLEKMF